MILITLIFLLFGFQLQAQILPEPSIGDVQREAIHYLGFNEKEAEDWKKKARLSAALPRLQLGYNQNFGDVIQVSTNNNVSISKGDVFVGPDDNSFDQKFNRGTGFDVTATWYLSDLIFNRNVLAASEHKRDWIRERTQTLEKVTEAYFTRQRLVEELRQGRDPIEIREKKKRIIDQATAMVDAYTGGWFSQQLQNRSGGNE